MAAEGFAAVPTWMIRDTENVSGPAIAVYGVLASYSGLRINAPKQETIAREARCGVRRTRDALIELEQLGVVERVKRGASGSRGRASDAYRLMDRPLHDDEQVLTASDADKSDLPAEKAAFTGTSLQSTPLIEVDRTEVDRTPTPYDLEALFSEAWTHWPKKKERKESLAKFKAKVRDHFKTDPQHLVDLIKEFGDAYAATTATQFVPALCFWLNRERWTDDLPEAEVDRRGSAGAFSAAVAADALLAAQGASAPALTGGAR